MRYFWLDCLITANHYRLRLKVSTPDPIKKSLETFKKQKSLFFLLFQASAIRRHISQSLRQRKGQFPCYYINEFATYTLPPGK